MKKAFIASVSAMALLLPAGAMAQEPIKIGILVALEGAFAAGGADGVRNVELALKQAGSMAGGRQIETVVAPTDTTPDTTIRQARKLIEQDKVDFIIGPLSGSEGIAMRDYAKTIPDKMVINGISGALETTWVDPAPNFFRFNLDGSQWGSGLGSYVVNEEGLEEGRDGRGRLLLRLHELPRLRGRLLPRRRRHRGAVLGAARLLGFRRRDRRSCPTTSMPSTSASAARMRSTSSTSTSRPAPRPT